MSKRRVYTDEFKREAVRLATERGNVAEAARDVGVHPNNLARWVYRLSVEPDRPFPGHGNPQDVEVAQIKRDNARLREENEILKKVMGIFTNRPS